MLGTVSPLTPPLFPTSFPPLSVTTPPRLDATLPPTPLSGSLPSLPPDTCPTPVRGTDPSRDKPLLDVTVESYCKRGKNRRVRVFDLRGSPSTRKVKRSSGGQSWYRQVTPDRVTGPIRERDKLPEWHQEVVRHLTGTPDQIKEERKCRGTHGGLTKEVHSGVSSIGW